MELNISSSALDGAEYDPETQTLILHWHGGSYAYEGVPPEVAEELENAGSQGAYAVSNIRDSYPYHKV